MRQGSEFKPNAPIHFKANGKGRVITLKPAEALWVTNTEVDQQRTGYVMLGRKTHHIGQGYAFTQEQVRSLFSPV